MGERTERMTIVAGRMIRPRTRRKARYDPETEACPDCAHLTCSRPGDLMSIAKTGHHPNCPTVRAR